jgi:hypothetical protein
VTFTERNLPPPPPTGPIIPEGVRRALLNWFTDEVAVVPKRLWQTLRSREGYGSYLEVAEEFEKRFGTEEGMAFAETMGRYKRETVNLPASLDYSAETALWAIRVPLFLDVLEDAVRMAEYWMPAIEEINRLFAKRGIYYRFGDTGQAEWHGDRGAHETILRPALDVLADSRLQGARSEFEAAMNHLRADTDKDREDAIEEAGKSVESVMKVVLHTRNVKLIGKETAFPLFDLLAKNGMVAQEADQAVLGTARLRNAYGGHGSGATVRQIPDGLPELAVRSAASAILYLAEQLP